MILPRSIGRVLEISVENFEYLKEAKKIKVLMRHMKIIIVESPQA